LLDLVKKILPDYFISVSSYFKKYNLNKITSHDINIIKFIFPKIKTQINYISKYMFK